MNEITEQGLRDLSFLDGSGPTEMGEKVLTILLQKLPIFTKRRWSLELFFALMSKNVPACVELVIIKDRKVLLTYRKDKYFTGWHTPGTYIAPGETWQETAQHCADRELKCQIRFVRHIASFSNFDSIRFHDLSNLILCEIVEGEPQTGKWFSECPPDMIVEHQKFWSVIERAMHPRWYRWWRQLKCFIKNAL